MFKNVDIAEVFNIRNFTHGGWYDKGNGNERSGALERIRVILLNSIDKIKQK